MALTKLSKAVEASAAASAAPVQEIREPAASLAAALLIAQATMQRVEKASTNQYHRYKYASAEDMIAQARAALNGAGLTLRRVGWSYGRCPCGIADTYAVTSVFELAHPHTNEVIRSEPIQFPCFEQDGRPIDKALGGALTATWGYYLRDLLLISKEDENDLERRDDRQHVAATIGPSGAGRLRRMIREAGLTLEDLIPHMQKAGITPPEDLAEWKREWMDRVETWLAKRQRERDAGTAPAPAAPPPST